mmetsp:Transcript_23168/g.34315  ORF Transcript_23168/g.34315 Transcript_23168/m.34315 type:complete len:255 (+) Transcript_23168:366-1130(+)
MPNLEVKDCLHVVSFGQTHELDRLSMRYPRQVDCHQSQVLRVRKEVRFILIEHKRVRIARLKHILMLASVPCVVTPFRLCKDILAFRRANSTAVTFGIEFPTEGLRAILKVFNHFYVRDLLALLMDQELLDSATNILENERLVRYQVHLQSRIRTSQESFQNRIEKGGWLRTHRTFVLRPIYKVQDIHFLFELSLDHILMLASTAVKVGVVHMRCLYPHQKLASKERGLEVDRFANGAHPVIRPVPEAERLVLP